MNFQQPEKTNPYHCHWKKNQLWKYEVKNDLKKKSSSSFNNPALFWYHKKMNNNEKKNMNSNQVWSHILKKNKFMYLKSTYPFFKYNSPKHCPISRKKCLFCIQNKKSCQTIIGQNDFEEKPFWFSSNKYTNLPPLPSNVRVHIFA